MFRFYYSRHIWAGRRNNNFYYFKMKYLQASLVRRTCALFLPASSVLKPMSEQRCELEGNPRKTSSLILPLVHSLWFERQQLGDVLAQGEVGAGILVKECQSRRSFSCAANLLLATLPPPGEGRTRKFACGCKGSPDEGEIVIITELARRSRPAVAAANCSRRSTKKGSSDAKGALYSKSVVPEP